MVIGQLGIAEVFAETVSNDNSPREENQIYHDYGDYQQALKEYNKEYAQYEKDLDEYNKKKQEHDDAQEEANRIEKENAEKKAAYEKALEQYQKDLDEYNKKNEEIKDHSNKGQYIGPEIYATYGQLQSYLTNFSAMNQLMSTGLSSTGDDLRTIIKNNLIADPYTGSEEVKSNIQKVVDEWNKFAAFEASIYGEKAYKMTAQGVADGASQDGWIRGFNGLNFSHTFTSSTGQTTDNVPTILDNPTETDISTALTDLFSKNNGSPFDSATTQMDKNTFMVDQGMVSKWSDAVNEAKKQGISLYNTAIEAYIAAFTNYNNSNYETADYNIFMDALEQAGKTEQQAVNLIAGMNGVSLADDDNSAPFYNDLKNLSASDLANKYGYTKLLSNMASEVTYGYFHLQSPEPGETIFVYTQADWSSQYNTFGKSKGNYEPNVTPPTEPTPPMYEIVPNVPDEPVPPVPPVKPVYEPLNTVNLLKVDKDTREPLAKAKFQLINITTNEIIGTFSSDNDGLIRINNLNPGNYSLIEIEAPEGYILDNTPISFIVHGTENEKIQLEKSNTATTGSVELIKTDEKTKERLQGAVFEIRNSSGEIVRSALQTNLEGKIVVDGLKAGEYSFIETKAPTGYVLDNTPIKFMIKKDQTEAVQVSMTNKLTPGGVILSKTDVNTGETLQGAVFELQSKDGKILQSGLKTDASGKVAVEGLEPGDYQFVETQAPTGYDLDQTPTEFTIEKGQTEAVQVSMTNKLTPGGVVLSKTDAKTGETLQGAVFELQSKDGKILQSGLKTDVSGKVAVEGLEPGDYQFVETQAPTGYDLDQTPTEFTIEKGQTEAVQVSMTNKLTPGGVVLSKTDAKTGEVLQGAVFELQNKNGKVLQSGLKTDVSGKVAVEGLEPGDYQFVETQAPTGYDLDQKPVKFAIEKGQTEALQVSMTNKPTVGSVVLNKIDSETGDKLAGAVFELRDNNGNIVLEDLKTDNNGKLAINDLKPGTYELVETKAPEGYILDSIPVEFTIKSNASTQKKVTKINKGKVTSVRLEKRDSRTNEMLAGAKFKLLNFEGKIIKENLVTNEDGVLTIDGLKAGDYQLVEVQAPTGYVLDETAINFTINKNSSLIKLTKLNTQENNFLNHQNSRDSSNSGYSPNTYSFKSLPKTGEKNSIWLVILGVIIMGIIAITWFSKRRK
ncbi:LPXTG cell wall anchor domain-containing protein [Enterococcus faecalis]|nr:LPXTG cell wall anchor domain-containing protein [Enterococcus faecalis]EJF1940705.1 LPXTG cell wall anchor domain-containing protein [Enterococcus faecalis]EJI7179234.1 LPXTG cell wall anchor domain-containing protein [Enterococcus faecalis]